jgi:hypothetical protein
MSDFVKQFTQENPATGPIDKVTFANLLGIQAIRMGDTIIEDICSMVSKKQYNSLEGYVLCLSRIMAHKVAWECIMVAFEKSKTSIPPHYYKLFQQSISTPVAMKVE